AILHNLSVITEGDAYNNPRNEPDGMHLEKRGFQQARQYEDGPRNFQEPRQYGDDPRIETRCYEDDYEDESNRFDGYPSGPQEARPYANDPRGIQKTT
ncbi:hypothetical protein M9458_038142, partial [Cirrhinus mrigala]